MAIIYSYPSGGAAQSADQLLITRKVESVSGGVTIKEPRSYNITLDAIANYIIETSPVVSGTGTPNYITMWGSSGSSIVDSPIRINSGTALFAGDILLDDDDQGVYFNGGGNVVGGDYLNIASNGSSIVLDGSDSALLFKIGNSTAVTINDNQDVGIGTTTPDAKLHVDDGNVLITSTSNANLRIERNDGAEVQVISKSNLGWIGTRNDMPFQIRQNGNVVANFTENDTISLSGEVSVNGALDADSLNTSGNIIAGNDLTVGDDITAGGDITSGGDINAGGDILASVIQGTTLSGSNFYVSNTIAHIGDLGTNIQFPQNNVIRLTASETVRLDTQAFTLANSDNVTYLNVTTSANNAQIDSTTGIRFSVGGDNKMTIADSGVISINAIGISAATANLVCPGSFQLGNSMAASPAIQPNLTAADAGTMTYHEGQNRSRLFMVMKTGENPDVYEQVVIKDNVY